MNRSDFANEFKRLADGYGAPELHRNRLEALWLEFRALTLEGLKAGVDLALQGDRYPSAGILRKCLEDGQDVARRRGASSASGPRPPGGFDVFGTWNPDAFGDNDLTRFVRYLIARKREDLLTPREAAELIRAHPELEAPFLAALDSWSTAVTYASWQGVYFANSAQASVVFAGQSRPTWLTMPERWTKVCEMADSRNYVPDLSRHRWDRERQAPAQELPL